MGKPKNRKHVKTPEPHEQNPKKTKITPRNCPSRPLVRSRHAKNSARRKRFTGDKKKSRRRPLLIKSREKRKLSSRCPKRRPRSQLRRKPRRARFQLRSDQEGNKGNGS